MLLPISPPAAAVFSVYIIVITGDAIGEQTNNHRCLQIIAIDQVAVSLTPLSHQPFNVPKELISLIRRSPRFLAGFLIVAALDIFHDMVVIVMSVA